MLLIGDVREKIKEIKDETIQVICTSPPYWGLRDYGKDDQIGQEATPDEFVESMVSLCQEFKRVLKKFKVNCTHYKCCNKSTQ